MCNHSNKPRKNVSILPTKQIKLMFLALISSSSSSSSNVVDAFLNPPKSRITINLNDDKKWPMLFYKRKEHYKKWNVGSNKDNFQEKAPTRLDDFQQQHHQQRHRLRRFSSLFTLNSSSSQNDDYTNNNDEPKQQRSSFDDTTKATLLQQENEILRNSLAQVEAENKLLKEQQQQQQLLQQDQQQQQQQQTAVVVPPQVIIEVFEGEGRESVAWYKDTKEEEDDEEEEEGKEKKMDKSEELAMSLAAAADAFYKNQQQSKQNDNYFSSYDNDDEDDDDDDDEELCNPYKDPNTCPVEPNISFLDAFKSRAYWLVGLLALQSCSGFILARNEELLQAHPVIVYFLTMLVGAGGNAGNQASVRVIRGLALGTLNDRTQRQFLTREFKMALSLSSILSFAGFARALIVRTPFPETLAITSALTIIVFTSICLGAILPLGLKRLGVDPAHSSTTIQVVMDILGVLLTVLVSTSLLDSPMGKVLISRLGF